MTEIERIRQRFEALVDRCMQHPDRIPAAEACTQVLAALDGPTVEERNPTEGLWAKRNTSSGHFDAVKRSGDVFKGVKREN